ncbi:hypothetical protein [Allosalinactinospora lopnorensis]|uniref:hypothetical protein n=1 Tax=Allosalinactinospora lopnorensis TaxID=1352348 RepID=UPI000623FBF0|nr:hypothetical protein [Allosalinactinospora lopnorensis]
MTGRLFYLVAGAALGGYVVHKLNRTARAWSPGGIADRVEGRVAGYRAALREFNEDVQDAMDRRETELLRRHHPAGEQHALGHGGGPPGHVTEARGIIEANDLKDGR